LASKRHHCQLKIRLLLEELREIEKYEEIYKENSFARENEGK